MHRDRWLTAMVNLLSNAGLGGTGETNKQVNVTDKTSVIAPCDGGR